MNTSTTINHAEQLGRAAFNAGKKAVPCMDDEFCKLLRGNKSEKILTLLNSWAYGWHTANVAALTETRTTNRTERTNLMDKPFDGNPLLWMIEFAEQRVAEAGQRQKTVAIKFSRNTLAMWAEQARAELAAKR